MKNKDSDVPVFVLCGGLGTRLREETEVRPKPMVPVGNRPILWHIMRTYSHHGFRRFILCLGYKAEVIKSYFLNYASMNSDFTVGLKSNNVTVHSKLSIVRGGATTATLLWATNDPTLVLQQNSSLVGPWNNAAVQASPYSLVMTNGSQFFRLGH